MKAALSAQNPEQATRITSPDSTKLQKTVSIPPFPELDNANVRGFLVWNKYLTPSLISGRS